MLVFVASTSSRDAEMVREVDWHVARCWLTCDKVGDYKAGAIAARLDSVSRWVVGVAESPLRSLM